MECTEQGGTFRRAVNAQAVRETVLSFFFHREEIDEAGSGSFHGWLVRSGKGLTGSDPYVSDDALSEWRARAPRMEVIDLSDESHETMMLDARGSACWLDCWRLQCRQRANERALHLGGVAL